MRGLVIRHLVLSSVCCGVWFGCLLVQGGHSAWLPRRIPSHPVAPRAARCLMGHGIQCITFLWLAYAKK